MFERINKNNLMMKNTKLGQYVVVCSRKVIL